jgi:hypothetical protein
MAEQTQKLGKLESVHGISPVYLQRALIVIILSFIFFMAMLIAFSLREQIGYFLLSTAFLIVNLFTLFGFMMQRKKVVKIYENGLTYKNQTCFYDDIKEIFLKETDKLKSKCEITKIDGEKILIPEIIHDVAGIVDKIHQKVDAEGVEEDEEI